MSQTIYWDPNTDSTTLYEVWSSADNVTFTLLGTVPAGTGGPNFDTNTNRYFWVDGASATTWYKVRASDGTVFSNYTIAKQGEPRALPTCRVYGRVVGFDGVPVGGASISVTILSAAADMSGQFIGSTGIFSDPVEAFADSNGDWEIDLAQGGVAAVSIASINLEKTFTVPATTSANLVDLI